MECRHTAWLTRSSQHGNTWGESFCCDNPLPLLLWSPSRWQIFIREAELPWCFPCPRPVSSYHLDIITGGDLLVSVQVYCEPDWNWSALKVAAVVWHPDVQQVVGAGRWCDATHTNLTNTWTLCCCYHFPSTILYEGSCSKFLDNLETSVSTHVGNFWVSGVFVMWEVGMAHLIEKLTYSAFLMYSTKHLTSVTRITYTCTVYVYTLKIYLITSYESRLLIALLILAIESHFLYYFHLNF